MWFRSRFFDASSSSAAWTAEAGTDLRGPTPPARPVSPRRMMWLFESFAAYGEAMYPSFYELGEHMPYRDTGLRAPYARGVEQYLEEVSIPWEAHGRPEPVEVPPAAPARIPVAPQRSWARRPLARLWSSLRRMRRTRQTRLTLESLDDETLHDIGVARCQIDRIATHENFY